MSTRAFSLKRKQHRSITDLPAKILAEILIKAAGNFPEDYANARQTCKAMRDTSNTFPIFKKVDLGNFMPTPWFQHDVIFLRKCVEVRNPEALFRMGLQCFVRVGDKNNGLKYLRMAVEVLILATAQ
ncbi:hypothetical protein COLO4_35523 [Corchorus olitorius]|uniref:At2g35280-like TPR domain-containing protein n=1 Tax=Corchorus olitorius TaxID=93759 RepID=A0A1R3GFY1_9ROSI|nr:hypothetical protein COLO4_35523 [Corchorus olitorius]